MLNKIKGEHGQASKEHMYSRTGRSCKNICGKLHSGTRFAFSWSFTNAREKVTLLPTDMSKM